MKVWEKLPVGYNRKMAVEVYKHTVHCPASVEAKHNLIGRKRMDKFCEDGCSVNCIEEYLDLKIYAH